MLVYMNHAIFGYYTDSICRVYEWTNPTSPNVDGYIYFPGTSYAVFLESEGRYCYWILKYARWNVVRYRHRRVSTSAKMSSARVEVRVLRAEEKYEGALGPSSAAAQGPGMEDPLITGNGGRVGVAQGRRSVRSGLRVLE